MDQGLTVRAALQGVQPNVLALMEALGVSKEQAGRLERFTLEALQSVLSDKVTIQDVLAFAGKGTFMTDGDLHAYAAVRNALSCEQFAKLDYRDISSIYLALKAKFSAKDAIALNKHGYRAVKDAIAARKAGISTSELMEAWAVRYDSNYVQAHKAGLPHKDLVEIIASTTGYGNDLGLTDYMTIIANGIATHEQVMAMLQEFNKERPYYAKFVLGDDEDGRTLSHAEAIEVLATNYNYPSTYWDARKVGTHAEVIEIGKTEMRQGEYVKLRQENPRVTHDEIVQMAQLEGRTSDLPTFIRLIDGGCTAKDIKAAAMSIGDYYYLRVADHGPRLSQEQTVEVGHLPIGWLEYTRLRREGIPHETIIANAT